MDFIAIADINGGIEAAERFADSVETDGVDGLIVAGDISSFPMVSTRRDLLTYFACQNTREILMLLSSLELPIYLVIGNDDFPETEDVFSQFPLVKNLHLNPVDFGDFEMIGFRGAVHVDLNTPTEYEDEEAYPVLADAFKQLSKPSVLVSHCPPQGVLDTTASGKSIGSSAVLRVIEEFSPIACLCGHVHELGGESQLVGDTLVANVGCVLNTQYSKVQVDKTISVESIRIENE